MVPVNKMNTSTRCSFRMPEQTCNESVRSAFVPTFLLSSHSFSPSPLTLSPLRSYPPVPSIAGPSLFVSFSLQRCRNGATRVGGKREKSRITRGENEDERRSPRVSPWSRCNCVILQPFHVRVRGRGRRVYKHRDCFIRPACATRAEKFFVRRREKIIAVVKIIGEN